MSWVLGSLRSIVLPFVWIVLRLTVKLLDLSIFGWHLIEFDRSSVLLLADGTGPVLRLPISIVIFILRFSPEATLTSVLLTSKVLTVDWVRLGSREDIALPLLLLSGDVVLAEVSTHTHVLFMVGWFDRGLIGTNHI